MLLPRIPMHIRWISAVFILLMNSTALAECGDCKINEIYSTPIPQTEFTESNMTCQIDRRNIPPPDECKKKIIEGIRYLACVAAKKLLEEKLTKGIKSHCRTGEMCKVCGQWVINEVCEMETNEMMHCEEIAPYIDPADPNNKKWLDACIAQLMKYSTFYYPITPEQAEKSCRAYLEDPDNNHNYPHSDTGMFPEYFLRCALNPTASAKVKWDFEAEGNGDYTRGDTPVE